MTNTIHDGNGDQLTAGVQDHEAHKIAQRWADKLGASVFLTDSDGEEWEVAPKVGEHAQRLRHFCSECGALVSARDADDTVNPGFCEAHPKATVESAFVTEASLVASDAATEAHERSGE